MICNPADTEGLDGLESAWSGRVENGIEGNAQEKTAGAKRREYGENRCSRWVEIWRFGGLKVKREEETEIEAENGRLGMPPVSSRGTCTVRCEG
jgi:hypothetical protein